MLDLELHPPYESWDRGSSKDQERNGRRLSDVVDVGRESSVKVSLVITSDSYR